MCENCFPMHFFEGGDLKIQLSPLPRYTDQTHSLTIESTVYRKPTHMDRYIDYNYNHPISTKLLSTPSSKELNKNVLHEDFLQK